MQKKLLAGLLPVTCLLSSPALAAGGHFAVDDATLTDAGRCQIETWYARGNSNNDEFTFLPACNPGGNLELTFGFGRVQEDGARDTLVELGAKTLFRTLEEDAFGLGLGVSLFHSHEDSRVIGGEALVPLSVELADDLQANLNVGWAWERDDRDAALWGVGVDYGFHDQVSLIAENYGSHRGGTRFGAGLRFAVAGLDLDLAYDVARAERRDDAVIVGLAYAF